MELKNLTKVRRFALGAVAFNVAVTAAAAWLLPRELQVLLPVVALMLPLLSTAAVEAAAEHNHVAG